MKQYDSLIKIINSVKGNKKELNIISNFVKKSSYFKGERRKIYSLIIKYKNKGGVNK